ncbi:thyrotropin-releasing hormone receptor-like isoform X2 [Paramacrobiotus metropolitanus]|nr:thyrotropin-releasing hormone receptor-like isoform X2 [Paramacrobiotus metropolitanus]XP_055345121.1 thyrotropin-releasing hormone receptor-like isoform X2 [Paramacrobiotus metropolitanus]XP_055345132.1 thyrotropin-releasing hormone receptor-like isoform X2 [Paramacrobiotus metropolitanus]XP_055345140.1 thyrotropin-releasing hormone receptor-like isoform X2 [Paramacrobiotus metropolitanus]XP_055345148.1 thyrotropin-releasing hormone receptor-like isoform X2 [Paramacrobiotus metropolitanus]
MEYVGGLFPANESTIVDPGQTRFTGGHGFSLEYRIMATVLHTFIFVLGLCGNVATIIVSLRTKSLQSPPYRYFVSLAFADLLVLISAVPEAIVFHNFGRHWMAGQLACSLLVYTNFLGINAGSISIFAFTMETYIAVCRPLIASRFCTLEATKKIILVLWITAVFYCAPWLALTEVKPHPFQADQKICDFRLSKEQYVYYFTIDLILFYVLPLLTSLIIYCKIIHVLHQSAEQRRLSGLGQQPRGAEGDITDNAEAEDNAGNDLSETTPVTLNGHDDSYNFQRLEQPRVRARAHILWMLIVIVVLFAVSWLPYRGLLIYNTFLEEPWLNLWYLLFAKTLIYLNSAMNPFLYSAMSRRFRRAMANTLCCRSLNYNDALEDIPLENTRVEPIVLKEYAHKTQISSEADGKMESVVSYS